MQASAQTCGTHPSDSMILNVGLTKVKSVYFNHPSHANSANSCVTLGPRDKAAPPTS